MKTPKQKKSGFTLIEIIMVIVILGIVATMSIDSLTNNLSEDKFEATLQEMRAIRNALVGDPTILTDSVRSDFGYLGDLGGIPTNVQGLSALVTNPALPAWAIDTTVRIGRGWNGPYISEADTGTSITTDAWGTAYVYDSTATPPTLISRGSDGAVGGTGMAADITMQIPNNVYKATVFGVIVDAGALWSGTAQVEMNFPDGNGGLTQTLQNVVAGDNGAFNFTNIPIGIRSATVYVPTKAAPTSTLGPYIFVADKNNYMIQRNAFNICAYPLDLITTRSSPAAYSLRRLRLAYAGSAIQVRRSSDSTTQDIGFSATGCGGLDTTALTAFVGAGNGFIRTWYDQAGVKNAVEGTAGNQPIIVSAGVVNTRNSKPAFIFNGTTRITGVALGLSATAGWSHSFIVRTTTTISGGAADGNGTYFMDRTAAGNPLYSLKNVGGKYCLQKRSDSGGGLGCAVTTTNISTTTIQSIYSERNYNVNFRIYLNDSLEGTVAEALGALTPGSPMIGHHQSTNTAAADYTDFEIIIWNGPLSATERTAVYNNQKGFYGF